MESALLIDIGSTYTKVSLLDLDQAKIIARSQAFTTVETDVNIGLKEALQEMPGWEEADYKLACSSAAGGLKIIAIGLVPDLTAEAAKRAALGAGSKVLKTYSYELSKFEIDEIIQQNPDIVLLAGGTDGGNKEVIIHNACMLAESGLQTPIIIAGNKVVSSKVKEILDQANKETHLTENVMPQLEELNIEPSRKKIREIFLSKIIQAKGLSQVSELIDGVIMPTPAAVLKAATLLADGYGSEPGLGELLVIDIGGATTDVHSIATGKPTKGQVNWRGLQEPYHKRTVEGDLGMRYSSHSLVEAIGRDNLKRQFMELVETDELFDFDERIDAYLDHLQKKAAYLPVEKIEQWIDNLLGRNASRLAVARHVGFLKTVYTPMGASSVQEGKDLTKIKTIIGTGGIIVNNHDPLFILQGALYREQDNPELLAPLQPEFLLDKDYLLAAIGLLAEVAPERALKLAKNYLKKL